jgi:uncharacterized membrane protein
MALACERLGICVMRAEVVIRWLIDRLMDGLIISSLFVMSFAYTWEDCHSLCGRRFLFLLPDLSQDV